MMKTKMKLSQRSKQCWMCHRSLTLLTEFSFAFPLEVWTMMCRDWLRNQVEYVLAAPSHAFTHEHDVQRSYYHKGGCAKLWVMMHELGHNLRFEHSGIGDDEYQDRSGYMGDSPSTPASFSHRLFRALGFGEDPPVRRAFVRTE